VSFEAVPNEPAPEPPEGLLARLRADPVRAPEHIALAASEQFGPSAARWAEQAHRVGRYNPHTLGEMARKRHSTLAGMSGAATGFGGMITMIPDLVALAWLQARMVFYIAGAFSWNPTDPMRPAELLALTDLYTDPAGARAALDGIGSSVAERWVGSKLARDEALATKLIVMVGKKAGKSMAGRMIPGFAIAFNAVSNRRDTNHLGRRAIAFYGQHPELPAA
jgi:hypothetical protein